MDHSRILVGAIDQGTSSSRFLIFDAKTFEVVASDQRSVYNDFPQKGWVEGDAEVLLSSVTSCMHSAVHNLTLLKISPSCIKAVGLTNQRETAVAFDIKTGKPLSKAISWLDARTSSLAERLLNNVPNKNKDHFKDKCGLPISNYPSALKMRWLLENNDDVKAATETGCCRFATVDTWLLWNLTGGVDGGVFKTDASNASRTGLLNIHTLQWDPELLSFFEIDKGMLAEVGSSCELYGTLSGVGEAAYLRGVPVTAIMGDQMAALIGQGCMSQGQTKNTYGTGCFLLCNTGTEPVISKFGLLTTVAYKLGPNKPVYYALEGSVAVAGHAISWLKDGIGLIEDADETESLAKSVSDSGDCYFVPAFSGLLCPYWNSYARGIICGLSQGTTKAHLVRACLEAICYQTKDVIEAMDKDLHGGLKELNVNGGVAANNFLMQLQSDILGIPIVRPSMLELTALGVASVAGSAAGVEVWKGGVEGLAKGTDGVAGNKSKSGADGDVSKKVDVFHPSNSDDDRSGKYSRWKRAVSKAYDWDSPNT